MIKHLKKTIEGVFLLNALPWVAVADYFKIKSNLFVAVMAFPSTIVCLGLFLIPLALIELVANFGSRQITQTQITGNNSTSIQIGAGRNLNVVQVSGSNNSTVIVSDNNSRKIRTLEK